MLAIKWDTIIPFEYHEASTGILELNLIAKPRTKKASLKDRVERLQAFIEGGKGAGSRLPVHRTGSRYTMIRRKLGRLEWDIILLTAILIVFKSYSRVCRWVVAASILPPPLRDPRKQLHRAPFESSQRKLIPRTKPKIPACPSNETSRDRGWS